MENNSENVINDESNNKKYLAIGIVFILAIIGFIVFLIVNKDDEKPVDTVKKELTLKDQVVLKEHELYDKSILISAKNESKKQVNIDISVDYYNEQNEKLSTDSNIYYAVVPQDTIYFSLKKNKNEYSKYKVDFKVNEDKKYTNETDCLKYLDVTEAEKGYIYLINSCDYKISKTNIAVLYYNKSNIVGYEEKTISDIDVSSENELEYVIPKNSDNKMIEFDDYFFDIYQSYNSN